MPTATKVTIRGNTVIAEFQTFDDQDVKVDPDSITFSIVRRTTGEPIIDNATPTHPDIGVSQFKWDTTDVGPGDFIFVWDGVVAGDEVREERTFTLQPQLRV